MYFPTLIDLDFSTLVDLDCSNRLGYTKHAVQKNQSEHPYRALTKYSYIYQKRNIEFYCTPKLVNYIK